MTTQGKTHWDRPSHFIGADRCRFGVTDVVNGHIISTVGDFRPAARRETIGCDRFYETMVFIDSGKRCTEVDCDCGRLPEPLDWSAQDFDGYHTEEEAVRGHAAMVAKYATELTAMSEEGPTEADMASAREWLRREAEVEPYDGQLERLASLLTRTRREERSRIHAYVRLFARNPTADAGEIADEIDRGEHEP